MCCGFALAGELWPVVRLVSRVLVWWCSAEVEMSSVQIGPVGRYNDVYFFLRFECGGVDIWPMVRVFGEEYESVSLKMLQHIMHLQPFAILESPCPCKPKHVCTSQLFNCERLIELDRYTGKHNGQGSRVYTARVSKGDIERAEREGIETKWSVEKRP
jgi:hypothetical protein